MANENDYLPEPWRRPVMNCQPDLFPRPTDEFLALARVSRDELGRWKGLGWIAFDINCPDYLEKINMPEVSEICFVRNIARSGLSDELITELLQELPKPYRYDPLLTAYSFSHGWVQAPPVPDVAEVDEVIEENLSDWIREQAEAGNIERLRELIWELFEATKSKGEDSDKEDAV